MQFSGDNDHVIFLSFLLLEVGSKTISWFSKNDITSLGICFPFPKQIPTLLKNISQSDYTQMELAIKHILLKNILS